MHEGFWLGRLSLRGCLTPLFREFLLDRLFLKLCCLCVLARSLLRNHAQIPAGSAEDRRRDSGSLVMPNTLVSTDDHLCSMVLVASELARARQIKERLRDGRFDACGSQFGMVTV